MRFESQIVEYARLEMFVSLSYDEILAYEYCLDYIVKNVSGDIIERILKQERDGLEDTRDSIRHIIMKYFEKDWIPEKAKDWDYALSDDYA